MQRSFVLTVLTAVAFTFVARARAGETPAASAVAAESKTDWEKMTFEQRKKLMKTKVMPELKKAFQAFDAKKYKDFSCATCHGDGAADGKFKMPNAKLPKLPAPTNREAFVALQQKKPEAVKFMGEVVKPKVAALIGLPEWSPQNPKGFGCYECHTHEDAH